MWPRLKKYDISRAAASQPPRGEEWGRTNLLPKLNVNEEYMNAFRTRSYTEIWSKVQCQIRNPKDYDPSKSLPSTSCMPSTPSSSSSLYNYLPESLLEPKQDSVDTILEQQFSTFFNFELRDIVCDFFSSSAEAFSTCGSLLQCINQAKINHKKIQRILLPTKDSQDHFLAWEFEKFLIDLTDFVKLDNPLTFSPPTKFQNIHDLYSSMQTKLRERKKKFVKKLKMVGLLKKVCVAGLTLACSAVTIIGVLLATNGFAGILTAPFILPALSRKLVTKRIKCWLRSYRSGYLKGLCAQLDAVARGNYIIDRDFDTMSRMVDRLREEIEHRRAIIRICGRNTESHLLREILREFRMNEAGFLEQIAELEEHVYLCFLTINKARRLVVHEITIQ